MKKIFLLIAILCCTAIANAAGKALQITFVNGTKAVYALDKEPTVTFSGDDFTIKSADVETSYKRADVDNFKFVVDSGIVDLTNAVRYSYSNNTFSCPDHEIKVYSLGGTLAAAGRDSISLRQLPNGVYVVRVNNHSIKIVKQ